ncbi:MAG: SpoIIE family protein phosphatase [bacterium]
MIPSKGGLSLVLILLASLAVVIVLGVRWDLPGDVIVTLIVLILTGGGLFLTPLLRRISALPTGGKARLILACGGGMLLVALANGIAMRAAPTIIALRWAGIAIVCVAGILIITALASTLAGRTRIDVRLVVSYFLVALVPALVVVLAISTVAVRQIEEGIRRDLGERAGLLRSADPRDAGEVIDSIARAVIVESAGTLRQISAVSIIALLVAVGLVAYIVIQSIVYPLKRLEQGTFELGRGNLDYRVEVRAEDEINRVAQVFNTMAQSIAESQRALEAAYRQLDDKVNQLTALHRIGSYLYRTVDMHRILRIILAGVVSKHGLDLGRAVLFLVDGSSLRGVMGIQKRFIASHLRSFDEEIAQLESITPEDSLRSESEAFNRRVESLVIPFRPEGGATVEEVLKKSVLSVVHPARKEASCGGELPWGGIPYAVVPLIAQDKVVGALLVDNFPGGERIEESKLRSLEIFANQAVTAIENARLYGELTQKERMEQELNIAHLIQMSLLPIQRAPEFPGLDIAGMSIPAMKVGGDYFDYISIDENHLGIVVADVAGKGIPAAFYMTMLQGALRSQAINNLSTRDVLNRVNRVIAESISEDRFITAIYSILNLEDKSLTLTSAGHHPILIYRNPPGEFISVQTENISLGIWETTSYDEARVALKKGDIVVYYTDGVDEARDGGGNMLGEERLKGMIVSNRHLPAYEMLQNIEAEIQEFIGEAPQHDDITMVVVKL